VFLKIVSHLLCSQVYAVNQLLIVRVSLLQRGQHF
jgi:hypothetical protein